MDKQYTSKQNYYPGRAELPGGTVFTEAEWEAAGGRPGSLAEHVSRGYITEIVQAAPMPQKKETPREGDPSPDESDQKMEDKKPSKKDAPKGIWVFDRQDIDKIPLQGLNTLYKDTAARNGMEVSAYTDKEELLKKLCSENGK